MKLFIDIVVKRIYLFNIVAWNYRKKMGFPVCKKENFAGLQAHRKRGKSARASPTPHHTLNEERSARFTAQPLPALDLTVNHTFVSFQNLTLQSYSIIFFICSVVFVENKTRHFTTEIEIHGNLQSYNDREKSHRQFLRGFFLCWIFSPCNQLWRQDRCCRYCVRQPRMGNICSLPHTFSN